jgi:hypothetical protein
VVDDARRTLAPVTSAVPAPVQTPVQATGDAAEGAARTLDDAVTGAARTVDGAAQAAVGALP